MRPLRILTLAFLLFTLTAAAQTDRRIEEQKRVIAALEKRIATEEQEISKIQKGRTATEERVRRLARQIDSRNQLLDETEKQARLLRGEIARTDSAAGNLSAKLERDRAQYGEMVREAYRNYKHNNSLTYIFSSRDFTDVARKITALREVASLRERKLRDIEALTADGRKLDTRHLYSGSTARTRVPSDQYYVSQQTNKGPVKVYEGRPSTDWDRSKESDVDVPVISHESGQRCVYPDFREIGKYTGPVEARNFELWREMLTANGMGDQAHDFFRASGALTAAEYKAAIEARLRSSKSAGFQLLSLNDFPGQGYAPVGVLDPFWDSKGLVTPEDWRAFCAPTVALLRYPKSAWFEDETFTAKAEVYNFGAAALKNAKIRWSITDGSGKAIAKGSLKSQTVGTDGVFPVGEFSAPLGKVRGPQKLTVHLNVGEKTSNSCDIWVYPRNAQLMQSDTEVLYTTEFGEQAKQYLAAGKKVVLPPAPTKVKGRKSTFHNHFWNPIMFAWAPMTIGCLIHAEQPVFADFPTSYHTDWQWWDILENAKVIEMQQTPRQLRPFIQVIDSFDNNEKLGIGFEARVGGGKLLVLAVDTKKKMDQRPATRQLLESIDRYVRSDRFAPEVTLDESFITSFMR